MPDLTIKERLAIIETEIKGIKRLLWIILIGSGVAGGSFALPNIAEAFYKLF